MNPDDAVARLLNPAVILTIVAAGMAYGGFLWVLHIRPTVRLYAAAVFPGAIFLGTVWAIRGLQGTLSLVYVLLLIDFLIYANTGFVTVVGWRAWRRRRAR